jgi:hypothetical protein
VVQSDIKGNLPASLVNTVAQQQAFMIASVGKELAEKTPGGGGSTTTKAKYSEPPLPVLSSACFGPAAHAINEKCGKFFAPPLPPQAVAAVAAAGAGAVASASGGGLSTDPAAAKIGSADQQQKKQAVAAAITANDKSAAIPFPAPTTEEAASEVPSKQLSSLVGGGGGGGVVEAAGVSGGAVAGSQGVGGGGGSSGLGPQGPSSKQLAWTLFPPVLGWMLASRSQGSWAEWRGLVFVLALGIGLSRLAALQLGDPCSKKCLEGDWCAGSGAGGSAVFRFPIELKKLLRYLEAKRTSSGVEINVTHVTMKAAAIALSEMPHLNGHLSGGNFYRSKHADVTYLFSTCGGGGLKAGGGNGGPLAAAQVTQAERKGVDGVARELREKVHT